MASAYWPISETEPFGDAATPQYRLILQAIERHRFGRVLSVAYADLGHAAGHALALHAQGGRSLQAVLDELAEECA